MVLESTIICCDNSNYQRNGDYIPTRLGAQMEAINLISLSKIRSHPENNVALMTISNSVEVLATLTNDVGKILITMGKIQPKGEINLITGLRIAHLVLKHRQGKHFRMRIVAFVGSPLPMETEEGLMILAKRFKKEKVQVDIVSYGEHEGNEAVLTKFIEALNGKDGDGSHIVNIPRGNEIRDLLVHSPIVLGEDGVDAAGLTNAYEYGIDPNEDPDLALALRISAEEERQRQAELLRAQEGEASTSGAQPAPMNSQPVQNIEQMTEEQQIAYALQMSLQQDNDTKTQTGLANNVESNTSAETGTACCSILKGKSKDKLKSKEKDKDKDKDKKKKDKE